MFRLFFALEVLAFGFFYLFGPNGLHALSELKKTNDELISEVKSLEAEVTKLEETNKGDKKDA